MGVGEGDIFAVDVVQGTPYLPRDSPVTAALTDRLAVP